LYEVLDIPYSTYYLPMGGSLKCMLKEGGGPIIRSFYKSVM